MSLRDIIISTFLSAGMIFWMGLNHVDEAIIDSKIMHDIALRYSLNHDSEVSISPDYHNSQETNLLLLHGFAASRLFWGYDDNPYSPLSIAHKNYDGNVMIAEYPSTSSIDEVADDLLDSLETRLSDDEKIDVLAYSMGGLVARRMVRERPELFDSVGLVAVPHSGFDIWPLTDLVAFLSPRYISRTLQKYDIKYDEEDLAHLSDAFQGSRFLDNLNTKKELPVAPEYHFFVLSNDSGNPYIYGDDDLLLSTSSTDPSSLIEDGDFEQVRIGSLNYFMGNVNHFSSFHHPEITQQVISRIKGDAAQDNLSIYRVMDVHQNEVEYMRRLGL